MEHGYTLSVEELAMSVALLGHHEDAARLLQVQFGQLQPEIARAYLTAASHSLLARGWLKPEDGQMRLISGLADLLLAFVQVRFSLHIQKRARGGSTTVLALHVHDQGILAHLMTQEVVHHLASLPPADLPIAALAFLEIPQSQWEGESTPVATVDVEAFRKAFRASSPEALQEALTLWDLPENVQAMLVEDFLHAQYRGAFLLVEYDEQRQPFSREGAFLLKGPERAWLFIPHSGQEGKFEVYPFSLHTFRTLLQTLLQKGRAHLDPSQATKSSAQT